MPQKHRTKKSLRLEGYDYALSGMYFVTFCTHERKHHLGSVRDSRVHLNDAGEIANQEIQLISTRWKSVELDIFTVMPNHVHIILLLSQDGDVTLGRIINALKGGITRRVRRVRNTTGLTLWQSSFYDHIVRNETELNKLREYVLYNPAKWEADRFFAG